MSNTRTRTPSIIRRRRTTVPDEAGTTSEQQRHARVSSRPGFGQLDREPATTGHIAHLDPTIVRLHNAACDGQA